MNRVGKDGPRWAGDVSADDAELLLSGRRAPEGVEALAEVLAAIARPEPAAGGYEAARQAFLDAGRTPGGHRWSSLSVSRIAAVKIGATAVALLTAGTAAAAEADVLPGPIQRVAHHVFSVVGVPAPKSTTRPNVPDVPKSAGTPEPATPGRPSASPAALPATSDRSKGNTAAELCAKAARSGVKKVPAADHHKLSALAGGDQNIAAYCAQVVGSLVSPTTSTVQPSPTGSTKTHPSHTPASSDTAGHDHGHGKT